MSEGPRIYWTSVEFKLKKTHDDFNNFKGGFVYAFVKCSDAEEALERVKLELDRHHLIPFDFEFLKPYDNVEWENEKDEKHYQLIIEELSKDTKVILDGFYMYKRT